MPIEAADAIPYELTSHTCYAPYRKTRDNEAFHRLGYLLHSSNNTPPNSYRRFSWGYTSNKATTLFQTLGLLLPAPPRLSFPFSLLAYGITKSYAPYTHQSPTNCCLWPSPNWNDGSAGTYCTAAALPCGPRIARAPSDPTGSTTTSWVAAYGWRWSRTPRPSPFPVSAKPVKAISSTCATSSTRGWPASAAMARAGAGARTAGDKHARVDEGGSGRH